MCSKQKGVEFCKVHTFVFCMRVWIWEIWNINVVFDVRILNDMEVRFCRKKMINELWVKDVIELVILNAVMLILFCIF